MSINVKICGLKTDAALKAAIDAGAKWVGFVFYPRSPRHVTIEQARDLVAQVPDFVTPVGLFVDPGDDELLITLEQVALRMVQLHGSETPERVTEIKKLTGLPVIKAIAIRDTADFAKIPAYEAVVDTLLFDAKPCDSVNALPGGNAISFDWDLLQGKNFSPPWMLAGGLDVGNLAEAVQRTGAEAVDVSSGVEDAAGQKNPDKIRALIELADKLSS